MFAAVVSYDSGPFRLTLFPESDGVWDIALRDARDLVYRARCRTFDAARSLACTLLTRIAPEGVRAAKLCAAALDELEDPRAGDVIATQIHPLWTVEPLRQDSDGRPGSLEFFSTQSEANERAVSLLGPGGRVFETDANGDIESVWIRSDKGSKHEGRRERRTHEGACRGASSAST